MKNDGGEGFIGLLGRVRIPEGGGWAGERRGTKASMHESEIKTKKTIEVNRRHGVWGGWVRCHVSDGGAGAWFWG